MDEFAVAHPITFKLFAEMKLAPVDLDDKAVADKEIHTSRTNLGLHRKSDSVPNQEQSHEGFATSLASQTHPLDGGVDSWILTGKRANLVNSEQLLVQDRVNGDH